MLTIESACEIAATWTRRGPRGHIGDAEFIRLAFPGDGFLQAALSGDAGAWRVDFTSLSALVGLSRDNARSRYASILSRLRRVPPHPR